MNDSTENQDLTEFYRYLENNGIFDMFYTFMDELCKRKKKPENPLLEIKKLATNLDDPDEIEKRKYKEACTRLRNENASLRKKLNIVYLERIDLLKLKKGEETRN